MITEFFPKSGKVVLISRFLRSRVIYFVFVFFIVVMTRGKDDVIALRQTDITEREAAKELPCMVDNFDDSHIRWIE